ncbi:MAG: cag pathogenicity island protein Cag6 [Burkholderiales bacterium PBB3]|nr:MAG: cag pathogenicity island protein Cag6 [Burkholderiales bacterium PBB3]
MAAFNKLGKYQIRRELGKGAMGVVYEGFDPVIERVVAIKTILPQQLGAEESQSVMARFKREAQAAGRLNHPHIVAIYDYGEVVAEDDHTMVAAPADTQGQEKRVAFIAMEFVKGKELRDYFEANERFALPEVQRIMGEMLSALGHAHSNGVVHRDMKPANLIVLDDGSIKVADFGIARVEKSELTQAGTVMGTPSYMSPEQFMGQTVDGRSDIFSCGVILYQFLTGEKPFTGNTTTIMYKVLREEPLAPSMLNVALPPAFDSVVKKAMAKNPDERFQTAQEFSDAIKAAVAGPPTDQTVVNTHTTPPPAQVAASAPTKAAPAAKPAVGAALPSTAPASSEASKSKIPLLAFAGVAAALVLGGVAYVTLTKQAPNATQAAAEVPAATASNNNPAASAQNAATTSTPAAANEPALEPGTMVISALGLVDPKDPKFKGDEAAALAEARADAKRQLVEKALALYVDKGSLDKNYAVLEQKLFSQSGAFIKTVLQDGTPVAGPSGLMEAEARAVVKVREVQKSLNQLSKDERIDFIRNNGDPKVAVQIGVMQVESAQALPPARSAIAENVLKERIRSFGFKVWSNEGDVAAAANAKPADFQVVGEVKLKLLSRKLEASGLTVSQTNLTSWTLKAIDKTSGEEIYLNTVTPTGKSWNTEDLALAEIGKLVGDEFSKNFFLQHFNFGSQKVLFQVAGLPDAQSAKSLLRELRGFRQVLDAQMVGDTGKYQLQLAEGSAGSLVQDVILKSLNTKLGQACFALTDVTATGVNASFSPPCAEAAVRSKMESVAPAGLIDAPDVRGKPLLKVRPNKSA